MLASECVRASRRTDWYEHTVGHRFEGLGTDPGRNIVKLRAEQAQRVGEENSARSVLYSVWLLFQLVLRVGGRMG